MEIVCDFRTTNMADERRRQEMVEPVLSCYQQVLGHDLPNRLVALQGLAVLLNASTAGPGQDDGETEQVLRQIAELSRNIDSWVRRVAEIGRLCRESVPTEPIDVAEVVREALAQAKMLFPALAVTYHWQQDPPAVPAPRSALHQVLVQLFRKVAASSAGRPVVCATVGVRSVVGGLELSIADDSPPWETVAQGEQPKDLFAPERATDDQRIGFFLARQLAAVCAGCLRIVCEPGAGNRVSLFLPSP